MGSLQKKHVIAFLVITLFSILIEVIIFNNNYFHILNQEIYPNQKYSIEDVEVSHGNVDINNSTITYISESTGWLFIILKDIDTNVGNIYMDLSFPDKVANYYICYTDEANSEYYRGFYRTYENTAKETHWNTCHFNGKSKDIIIRIEDLNDGYTINFNGIEINKPIPFRFSIVRFSIVLFILITLYSIRHTAFFISKEKRFFHNLILCAVCCVFILISYVLYINSYKGVKLNLMYNTSFIDSLINKQLALDIDVSDELLNMTNPYDTSARELNGVPYSWDTAYYNGNYYCYYGIVPALLFYVPYKLLTGNPLDFYNVVFITYCIYLIFLDLFVIRILRYKLPDTPFGVEFLSLIILNAATNIFFFATEPTFYIMLYSSGLMFAAIGLYAFSLWYTKYPNKALLFIGATSLSLAVGCRPPLLVYTLFIIPFGIKKIKDNWKKSVSDMIVLLFPYIIIGSLLATYNYLRFDSITEFGQTYQLTAQDQLHSKHSIDQIPILLWLGFFQPLNFSSTFPFVFSPDAVHNYAGQFFTGSGLTPLLSQVPLLIVLFSPFMWKKWFSEADILSKFSLSYIAILGVILMIAEYLNAGVEWRYTSEIAPVLCIVAIMLISNLAKNLKSDILRLILTIVFVITLYTFAVSFFKSLDGAFGYMVQFHPEFYYKLERLFCFWK